MTLEEMRKRKKELGYSNETVSRLSGIPLSTVVKIFGGITRSPRSRTIQALERVLFPADPAGNPGRQERPHSFPASTESHPGFLGEPAPAYGVRTAGKHTVDDYYSFKDEKRRELIDGKFFIMEAPSVKHQAILGELYILFRECMRRHEKNCRALLSPCDVQLDADRYTMVQPDLLIVCDPEKIRTRICTGAPDLIVEIMSQSSRSRDSVLKLNKYMQAGVREYWLVDPENSTVIVYLRDTDGTGEGSYHCYSFSDTIPVGLSEGQCSIDFSIVAEAVEELTD